MPVAHPSGRVVNERVASPCARRSVVLWQTRGSQLVEFALVLPLLLVLLIGVFDFAIAYNFKHIMNNAAREGARIANAQGLSLDLTQNQPPSIAVIREAVVTYLSNAGVNTSFIGSTMTNAGNFTWTYYSSGTYGLKIERNVQVVDPSSGVTLMATRVTLSFPYNWMFGFDQIIGLLVPSAIYAGTVPITTDALMSSR